MLGEQLLPPSVCAMQIVQQLSTALADRYVIKGEIGSGGMAVVYEAHDVRHRRSVAIKVLNPDLGAVLGVTRFLEEIRVTANLQHPNLLPLFDSGEANGLLFYVMPYIQGETLRGRLTREKQLPIDDAVHIAASVAGALAYAHAHGVIHRDLKPENILLQQGQPMVADFGIALAVSKAAGERITQTGISLGTPQYMSPEQATGDRVVDGRSDIYSLAAVLHEMLTGDPPHSGNTVQSIIAKVLTEEPVSVRVARPNVPDHIAHAISRGLQKVPADRWPSAQAFADALTGGSRVSATDVPAFFSGRSRRSGSRRQVIGLAALFAVVGGAIGAAIAAWPGSPPRVQLSTFALTLPDSAALNGGNIALSPDGSLVAYVGGSSRSVFVRPLDDVVPRRVVGTEGAYCPSFSPDGRWILFAVGGKAKKVALRGGAPIVLADSVGRCAVWTDRDEIIFDWREQLFLVSADGGPISVVVPTDTSKPNRYLRPIHPLPGGESALIGVSERYTYEWQVGLVSLSDGKITKLTTHTGMPRTWPRYAKGHVLYREGTGRIVAVPFSLRTHQFIGPEVTILDDTINTFSVAENGSLAFLAGGSSSFSLVAVAEGGQTRLLGGDIEQMRRNPSAVIPIDTATFAWPRLSPDGKRVLLEMLTGPVTDVWVYDIAAHTVSRLTSGFTGMRPSGWTADGRNVVFLANDSATPDALRSVVAQPWDGSAPPHELFRLPVNVHDVTLGPPHGYAAFTVLVRAGRGSDIWIAPLDTPKAARPFVATAAYDGHPHPRLTRDGTLLAYTDAETGRPQVYVRPVLGPAGRLQVSVASGWQPVWSADGRQLYYRTQGYMMRATIARGSEMTVTRRDTLFKDDFVQHNMTNYDVFPGGKELLMIRAHPNPVHAGIVLNWPELLRQRARTLAP